MVHHVEWYWSVPGMQLDHRFEMGAVRYTTLTNISYRLRFDMHESVPGMV